MKERPIIFSGPMVRAIIDGRKTQTRRVVKPQPEGASGLAEHDGEPYWLGSAPACPYGVHGDRLWVREAWGRNTILAPLGKDNIVYKADDPYNDSQRWRSPIHMPRIASRLALLVTDILVERVRDISEQDAQAEGVQKMHLDDLGQTWKTYRRGFQSLWDSIYAKRGCGWDTNPWVWVIFFKRIAGGKA